MTDPTPASAAPPRSLFRDGSFLRLWGIGSLIMGTRWFEILATSVFTFAVTESALAVALVQFARQTPNLLFGAFAGAIADRFDRRTLTIAGQVMLVLVTATLWLLAELGWLNPWHIALGAFLNGIVFSGEFPVRRAMMAEIAGVERVGRAMSLDLTANNATRILGPALGGLVYETLGISGVYLASLGVFLVCIVLAVGVVQPPRALFAAGRSLFSSVAEGIRFIRGDRALTGFMAITVIMNIWGFPYAQMVPVMAKEEMNLSAFPIGILLSGEGVGALVGSLLVAAYARRPHFKKLYFYGALLLIVCGTALALSRIFELAFVITCIGGLGIAGFTTMQATLPYLLSPPEMRARVMGVLSVCVGTAPIGILNLGIMSEWVGAANAMLISGIEGLVAMTIAFFVWRQIR